MMNAGNKANWIGFVLHFLFGLFVGPFVAVLIISKGRRGGFWMDHHLILPYLIAAALIGAGLGAKLGDRLWIGSNFRVIPPDGLRHSKLSLWLALFTISFGALLVVTSLVRQFFL